ncbi:response regulator [Crateriforma conspicua]|uniref:Transcriptional regulatory protein DegU n=1 Tax=Crateriforma conspicua TaxID=2527996 RepID=A0A5C6FNL3_9PLAN|nr:response regulator transcription factor [Crateriforma conspicua]TWU64559.1 Transcriptional regulatory protein DegU [Crateriforma conspicua]
METSAVWREIHVIGVLLIEDHLEYRRTLSRVIDGTKDMMCIGQFSSIEDAQETFSKARRAKASDIDVILLDVGLPGINGIDGLPILQQMAPQTRIIVLTVFDDPDKVFRAICGRASGYLLKSSEPAVIEQAIRDVVAGGAPMSPTVARRVLDLFNRNFGAPAENDYRLTDRENEVLKLMADGLIKKEIAAELGVSPHTVHTHLRNIYDKLHVHTRSEAVAKAIREGLV